MISIDPSSLSVTQVYKLLIGSIVPRPIAWISTLSTNGISNLAPFSFYNGVTSKPPTLVVSIGQKADGSKKDTLRNILETKEFVVNSSSGWDAKAVNDSAEELEYEKSEIDKLGLETLKSNLIKPPRIASAAISFECKLYNTYLVGDGGAGSATLVVGEIVWVHLKESVYQEGKILIEPYEPLARLGGFNYAKIGEIFELKRL